MRWVEAKQPWDGKSFWIDLDEIVVVQDGGARTENGLLIEGDQTYLFLRSGSQFVTTGSPKSWFDRVRAKA